MSASTATGGIRPLEEIDERVVVLLRGQPRQSGDRRRERRHSPQKALMTVTPSVEGVAATLTVVVATSRDFGFTM